jgi:hypothetical protein
MSKKPYEPVATYADLKQVEQKINQAETVDKIRELVLKDGPKVGYKAFCYMLGGRMTAEALKPDEACTAAAGLEQQGKSDEALAIYKRVLEAHPNHAIAKSKVSQ